MDQVDRKIVRNTTACGACIFAFFPIFTFSEANRESLPEGIKDATRRIKDIKNIFNGAVVDNGY